MFGIISNGKLDSELFNEMYAENKEIIDNLVFYIDNNSKLLDVKIDEVGYDKAQELRQFLNACELNYTTINLIASLEAYSEKKEDEFFLDLYMAIQDGNIDEFLENCDMTEMRTLYTKIKSDETLSVLLPDIEAYVLEREKGLHR